MIKHVLLKLVAALLHTLGAAHSLLTRADRIGTLNLEELSYRLLVILLSLSTSLAMPNLGCVGWGHLMLIGLC